MNIRDRMRAEMGRRHRQDARERDREAFHANAGGKSRYSSPIDNNSRGRAASVPASITYNPGATGSAFAVADTITMVGTANQSLAAAGGPWGFSTIAGDPEGPVGFGTTVAAGTPATSWTADRTGIVLFDVEWRWGLDGPDRFRTATKLTVSRTRGAATVSETYTDPLEAPGGYWDHVGWTCVAGDVFEMFMPHSDGSSQPLESSTVTCTIIETGPAVVEDEPEPDPLDGDQVGEGGTFLWTAANNEVLKFDGDTGVATLPVSISWDAGAGGLPSWRDDGEWTMFAIAPAWVAFYNSFGTFPLRKFVPGSVETVAGSGWTEIASNAGATVAAADHYMGDHETHTYGSTGGSFASRQVESGISYTYGGARLLRRTMPAGSPSYTSPIELAGALPDVTYGSNTSFLGDGWVSIAFIAVRNGTLDGLNTTNVETAASAATVPVSLDGMACLNMGCVDDGTGNTTTPLDLDVTSVGSAGPSIGTYSWVKAVADPSAP